MKTGLFGSSAIDKSAKDIHVCMILNKEVSYCFLTFDLSTWTRSAA